MARQQIDKSNLGYLGLDFQYKLVKTFIEEPRFFEEMCQIVDQNAFTDPLLRGFVGTVKDYYTQYGVVPSYEVANMLMNDRARTTTDIEESNALIKMLRFEVTYEGYELVKDMASKFFKQQNLIKAANKMLEIAGSGDIDRYDECRTMLDEAMMAGNDEDMGFSVYDKMPEALSSDSTISIPTGIAKLDETLGGGLDKGKLGLIIAPAGFGKTSFTTAVDAFAATYKCDANNHQGFKVLQIYFEDTDIDLTRKHFSRITQWESRTMKRLDEANRTEVEKLLMNYPDKEMLRNNLRLKRFRTGSKTATEIEVFIKKLINKGFKPDLVSIDYFECLAHEKGGYQTESEWNKEGVTMRKLENIAADLDIAIWIPTQGTKDSMNSPEFVRMDQASGSAKKVHVAQLIISIARSIDDIDNCRAVVSILKNRSGKSGKVFNNVYFNNGTCTIQCDDMVEFDSQLAWEEESADKREKNIIDLTRQIAKTQRQVSVRDEIADNGRAYFGRT